MRTARIIATACVLICAASAARAQEPAPIRSKGNDHPRLFLTPQRLKEIRERIKVKDSHHALAFAAMKDRVDNNRHGGGYGFSYRAREAAMMALLSEDAAEAKKYAEAALEAFRQCNPLGGSGLARGMHSLGMGVAYDWCCNLWTDEQRRQAKAKVDAALDAWPKFSHANLGDVRGSNWVAVTRGGELVLLLGAGQEKARAERFKLLKAELILHMQNGFGDLGVSQEGIGYTEYPGAFLLPAVFAAASLGDEEMLKVARTRAWWKMAMYTHTFQPRGRKTFQTGVTSGGTMDQGWSSLQLHLCPKEQLPYFLWWYDRHQGTLYAGGADKRFDPDRAGTVWALAYYPADVQAKDPTGVLPAGVADDHGYYFFRNRWKDGDDVQAGIMADAHHHGHAWDQPEQLALNLLACDTRFIGGPVKGRDDKLYSSLLVDGKYNIKDSTKLVGEKVAFEAGPTGGYAIVGGGALYKALGVQQAQRHLLVDFSPGENRAVLATLDRITSDAQHTYTWQANVRGGKGRAGEEAGRPFFLLTGSRGFLKGWVLHPAGAKVTAGSPLRIEAAGASMEIWVVMLVGAGEPPAAKIAGDGLGSTISILGKTVSFDAAGGRMSCK